MYSTYFMWSIFLNKSKSQPFRLHFFFVWWLCWHMKLNIIKWVNCDHNLKSYFINRISYKNPKHFLKLFSGTICSCYYHHFTSTKFFISAFAGGFFYWSLSDRKFPQVSQTLLSILADLSNTVIGMVSIPLLISYPSSLFTWF